MESKEIAIAFAKWMDNRRKKMKFRLAKPNEELFNEFIKTYIQIDSNQDNI